MNVFGVQEESESKGSCSLQVRGARDSSLPVGQYYWGPYTLFPPHWTGQRFTPQHAEVQELFAKLGVPQFLPWPDFYAILASISAAADRADAGKDPVMLSAAVHVFGHLADEVDHELFESEGSYAVDGGAPVGSAAIAQETSEFAASPTLRQFLDAVKGLRCVPTAGGSWATLQEVRFLHDRQHMATWRGEALQLVAGLADAELPSWEAERLKRAFRYCGLSMPIVSRQARVLRWHRGKEAALAAGLLLAAVRWLLEDGAALRVELAEVLRSATRAVEFVEARPADDEPDQEDSAPVQLEEVVEVTKLSAEILAPGSGENSTALLLRSQQAHEDSKNFALVRTPLQMEGYVGYLQEAQEGLAQGVLVVAFAGDAAQAMTTPLAGHIVQQLVDHCLALADGGCEQTADLAPMKRKLLSRLQQAACQLQTTPPRRLESPALAVERAVRQAGYTGGGSPEDLLPPWAPTISAPAEAETEAIGARTQRWVEAGARTEEPAELPLTVPESDEEEDPEPAALGSGMAASAAKALSKRTPTDATAAPPKSSFVPGLPMAETSAEGDAAVSQSGAGLQPGTRPPGPGFGAGVAGAAGAARENRGAPRLSGGFGIGSRSAEALEKQLRGMVDSFGKEPDGDGQGRHDQDSWSLRAEVDLSAEARASLAQLAELPQDEFTELVGRLGEEAAMHALKKQGFDVIWANGVNETGLPFDLVVRPATNGRRPWPPALAALAQCAGQPKVHPLREIEAALAKLPEAAVVEVKASLADARGDVFDISPAQMAMAQRLGDRYWLALVRKLAAGAGRVQVLQDMDKGVREGRVKLLLVA
ncbi:Slc35f5 [Symbiodinium natans]|uniref:Slc35f5 protein n=1 Tax=Symbiodinium natans TaxID=878477 RepID=A0A812SRG2_9DINO|nr:Slc35f5 [Symbiodinium natans]